MNLKRIVALILSLLLVCGSIPILAAELSGPDLIVSDVRLSNPYYKVGDMVTVIVDVKNVGGVSTSIESTSLIMEDVKGLERLGEGWVWTRGDIEPNQVVTIGLSGFRITDESVFVRAMCNSSSNKNIESNLGNNRLDKAFTPIRAKQDLTITDIRVNNPNFANGDAVTFDIDYENRGTGAIPYSSIEITLSINGRKYMASEVTGLAPREQRTVTSEAVFIEDDSIEVTADVNVSGKVGEDNLENNSLTKTFGSYKDAGSNYTWEMARLGGGGCVQGAYFNPKVKDEVFVMADMNGPYRHDQYSGYNDYLFSTLPKEHNNIHYGLGMAAAPDDQNILYYCGGQVDGAKEGIYKDATLGRTFDGGKTWEFLPKPFTNTEEEQRQVNSIISFDPNNSNIVYVCSTDEGLWRTNNALDPTVDWEKLEIPGLIHTRTEKYVTTNVILDEKTVKDGKTQTIYVSVENLGVFQSVDGGESFNLIPGSSHADIYNMYLDAKGRIVIFCGDGIFRYENGAWNDISPVKGTTYRGAVNPNNAETIVTVVNPSTGNIQVTTNGGTSWKAAVKSDSLAQDKIPWHDDTWFHSYVAWLRFDPFRNNRVLVGNWFGVSETMDITAEEVVWEEMTYGNEELCVKSLVSFPEGEGIPWLLLGVHDVGALRIDTPFDFSAQRINEPYMNDTSGVAFCEKQPKFMARVGHRNASPRAGNMGYSTDGGITWKEAESYPMKADGVNRANHGKIAVAADFNADGIPAIITTTVESTTTVDGQTITAPGRAWRSADLGKTWTPCQGLPNNMFIFHMDSNEAIAADKVNKDIFYAYDATTGNFLVSQDNGISFHKKSTIMKVPKNRCHVVPVFGKEGHVYVSLGTAGLYYSENYGQTFNKLEGVNEASYVTVGAIAPCSGEPTVYIYGNVNGGQGVFRSVDKGTTWTKISDENQNTLWGDFKVLIADRRKFGMVYFGTHGLGLVVGYPADQDYMPPWIGIYNDIDGKTVNTSTIKLEGGSTEPGEVHVNFNGTETVLQLDENDRYAMNLTLKQGENKVSVYAVDKKGNRSVREAKATFNYQPNYVGLNLGEAYDITTSETYYLSGKIETNPRKVAVYVDDAPVSVDKTTGMFQTEVPVTDGLNTFAVKAVTDTGITETVDYTVDRDVIPPDMTFENLPTETSDPLLILKGTLSEPATFKVGTNSFSNYDDKDLNVEIPVTLTRGENTITIDITDICGNVAQKTVTVNYKPVEKAAALATGETIAYQGTPEIDGVIDEQYMMYHPITKTVEGAMTAYGRFGLLADDQYLYFAVEINDDKVVLSGSAVASSHTEDTVELCFDPEHNKATRYSGLDQQLRLGLDSVAYSCTRSVALNNVVTKMQQTEKGYILEAAIPWTDLNIEPESGGKFGFDVCVNDVKESGIRDSVCVWNGTNDDYRDTSKFGTVYIYEK